MYGEITVTYQDIWQHINQLEVWRDILHPSIQLYQLTTNPFRPDKFPNCHLREWKGLILLTDFAYPRYNKYTCVHAVADIYSCSLTQAAQKLYSIYVLKEYRLGQAQPTVLSNIRAPHEGKGVVHFVPFTKDGKATYTELDKAYWTKRFVSSAQLHKLNVYSVQQYWLGSAIHYPIHPAYAYYFPQTAHTKIYIPAEKKFFGTATSEDIWKVDRGSNVCLLSKSAKDVLVLENLVADFDIHAFQSEGVVPDLTPYNDYDRIIIFYDNDAPGIEKSKNLLQLLPNAVEISLPLHLNVKDPDELIVKYGYDFAYETVQKLIYDATTQTHAPIMVGAPGIHQPDTGLDI